MGELTISVAGRAYQVICEDGEENRLTSIAARVDHEAQAFSGAAPSLSEARLLLMCSLLLADKLDEAETTAPASPAPTPPPPAPEMAEIDTSGIEEAIVRIADMAGDTSSDIVEIVEEPAVEEPVASDAEQEQAPARPSKSSAATAAEKDLLSWLDRPEPRVQSSAEPSAPEPEAQDETADAPLSAPDEPIAEAVEEVAQAPFEEDAPSDPVAPEEPPVESEDEIAARERSERRARRRARLAGLAKQEEAGD